jgi:sulfur-oxidizing protein SoxA
VAAVYRVPSQGRRVEVCQRRSRRPTDLALALATTLLASLMAIPRDASAQPQGRSGYDLMSRDLQAMQRDDSLNPGMLWVLEGQALWTRREGAAGRACADCHGATPAEQLRGTAATYPAWDALLGKPVTLGERIAQCRTRHQGLAASAPGAQALLALEAAVAHASRSLPMRPPDDTRLTPWRERGQKLWLQRLGQLDLSCAQCHDERAGGRLGGAVIPPGNAAGYPTYRLEWQGLGTLQRRLRNCMTGVRAEPYAIGSDEMRALEVYLAWRDRGLAVEVPAVRP